jgi:L-seryl-tRNA(Ser) seleniumtransferase
LRALPPAHALLESDEGRALAKAMPADVARDVVRDVLDELRRDLLEGRAEPDRAALVIRARERLAREAKRAQTPRLRRVINATGVVLHTNLGRAPLGTYVLDHVREVAQGYATLEYDLEAGRRGHRDRLVSTQIAALVGGEDALVVNNCAAAVLLVATALAAGREVVVSRGELVEIGGGFRVPEIIAACGARLVEVGTTNRTRIGDYERAANDATGMLLKVHRSNFDLVGFTAEADLGALAALANARGVPLVYDLGSGAFVDTADVGLPHEPTAREAIASGVDLVLTSGDKLLGGPQAGLVIGRRALVDRLRAHPLARALRPGRLVLAALEATMRAYAEGAALERIPVVAMLAANGDRLRARAEGLAGSIRAMLAPRVIDLSVTESEGRVGGGSMPSARLTSWSVRVAMPVPGEINALERALRMRCEPPIVARIEADRLVFDVRTVADDEAPLLARGLAQALQEIQKEGGNDGVVEIERDRDSDEGDD